MDLIFSCLYAMQVLEPTPGSRALEGSNTTKCQHSQEDPRTSMKVLQSQLRVLEPYRALQNLIKSVPEPSWDSIKSFRSECGSKPNERGIKSSKEGASNSRA